MRRSAARPRRSNRRAGRTGSRSHWARPARQPANYVSKRRPVVTRWARYREPVRPWGSRQRTTGLCPRAFASEALFEARSGSLAQQALDDRAVPNLLSKRTSGGHSLDLRVRCRSCLAALTRTGPLYVPSRGAGYQRTHLCKDHYVLQQGKELINLVDQGACAKRHMVRQ